MLSAKSLRYMVVGVVLAAAACAVTATVVPFTISGTYTQGGSSSDLPSTNISLGGAGSFTLDPGGSWTYFDFRRPGGGTFSTNGVAIGSQYFLRSYSMGDVIGVGNFGFDVSQNDDSDAILVSDQTAGVWGGSHSGYLGFNTAAGLFGWIEYGFVRENDLSTITFVSGAYSDEARADILAGETGVVSEPFTAALVCVGLLAASAVRRSRSN